MINLIPPHGRTEVVREYWVRFAAICLGMFGFAFLLLLALQVPTFVLVSSLEKALGSQINSATEKQLELQALEKEIEGVNTLIQHLEPNELSTYQFTELVSTLDTIAGNQVALNDIDIARNETGAIGQVTVQGVAVDRASLSAFKVSLEESALFEEAVLPISSLAKDKDITFSMQIIMATPSES